MLNIFFKYNIKKCYSFTGSKSPTLHSRAGQSTTRSEASSESDESDDIAKDMGECENKKVLTDTSPKKMKLMSTRDDQKQKKKKLKRGGEVPADVTPEKQDSYNAQCENLMDSSTGKID